MTEIWNYELFSVGGGQSIRTSQLIFAIVLLVVGWFLSRLVSRLVAARLAHRNVDATAVHTVRKVLFYVLLIAVVLTALHLLHIPIAMFAFLGGAVAIGVGFGTRNLINNFISGWILLAERPVRIEDLVEVDGNLGRVKAIGGRSTQIRRIDGVDILVPNSLMIERTLVNWTHEDRLLRTTVRVGVAYGSPIERVAELLEQAAREHTATLEAPEPLVIFEEFGDNALTFDLLFWCQVGEAWEVRKIRSEVRFRIDALFREAGITIAFPQRDVHLDARGPIEVRVLREVPGGREPSASPG